MNLRRALLATALMLCSAGLASADTVNLLLKANGTWIKGGSSVTSLGRADTIECLSFHSEIYPEQDPTTGLPNGRRKHEPVRLVKPIDKATPMIADAVRTGATIDGVFRFFRPANPLSGAGAEENYYTVHITGGRVIGQRQWLPNQADAANVGKPAMEEVSITFGTIEWTWNDGGITSMDDWTVQP